jgi:16S rRNA (cytosine1402-N4)-methyltransferase
MTKDHIPVLLDEVIKLLEPKDGKIYLDCTFGAGGYTSAILGFARANVVSIDQDPSTLIHAERVKSVYGDRFKYVNDNFKNLGSLFEGKIKFDGAVYDLGVSSMQLDHRERGFSFQGSNKLDMRMSSSGISAYDIVNSMPEEELANIIYLYSDERNSRRIAKNIAQKREIKKIETTSELAEIISSSFSFRGKIHPATKTFQAIRIAVNDEVGALHESLNALPKILNTGARVLIVTFHSLEDKIVKEFFKTNSIQKVAISKYKKQENTENKAFKIITSKSIKPTREEVINNPRSRSAKLRVAEKIEVNHEV